MFEHQLELGDITIDVVCKDIKNIHLSIYPPGGRVHIAAPARMSLDAIRMFALTKLGWIKQQRKIQGQARETPREYLERESHYLWGERYLLRINECEQPASLELQHKYIMLTVRPGTDTDTRQRIIEAWYRDQIKQVAPAIIARWESVLVVQLQRFFVQRMKTRWGSCNPTAATIRLNTELAKKPPPCLEYIIVHELMHLLEPTHNRRFIDLMNQYMPHWQDYRDELNRLPVRHEEWRY